jgi:lipoprotein-releasing system permease protein
LISPPSESQPKKIGRSVYTKIIEERVLFTFDGKTRSYHSKGVDANFSKVNNRNEAFNGNGCKLDTDQVVIWHCPFSMGLLDFNRQLEVLVQNPKR